MRTNLLHVIWFKCEEMPLRIKLKLSLDIILIKLRFLPERLWVEFKWHCCKEPYYKLRLFLRI